MNRRKFLTGIAGVTASGVVLAKDPVTTQLSPLRRTPFTNWTMQIQQPTDNYFRHGDGLVDIDGRFRLAKFHGEKSPLSSKPTSVVIKAGKKWVTVVSLQYDEIY